MRWGRSQALVFRSVRDKSKRYEYGLVEDASEVPVVEDYRISLILFSSTSVTQLVRSAVLGGGGRTTS